MKASENAQNGRYDFKFAGVTDENEPNYIDGKAQSDISKDGQIETSLFARKTFLHSKSDVHHRSRNSSWFNS